MKRPDTLLNLTPLELPAAVAARIAFRKHLVSSLAVCVWPNRQPPAHHSEHGANRLHATIEKLFVVAFFPVARVVILGSRESF
jgi:hypothetical protein